MAQRSATSMSRRYGAPRLACAARTATVMVALLGVDAASDGSAPAASTSATAASQLPAPPASGELGYILTEFAPAIYQGKDDCPEGLAGSVR